MFGKNVCHACRAEPAVSATVSTSSVEKNSCFINRKCLCHASQAQMKLISGLTYTSHAQLFFFPVARILKWRWKDMKRWSVTGALTQKHTQTKCSEWVAVEILYDGDNTLLLIWRDCDALSLSNFSQTWNNTGQQLNVLLEAKPHVFHVISAAFFHSTSSVFC